MTSMQLRVMLEAYVFDGDQVAICAAQDQVIDDWGPPSEEIAPWFDRVREIRFHFLARWHALDSVVSSPSYPPKGEARRAYVGKLHMMVELAYVAWGLGLRPVGDGPCPA
jgi:hypothetical protein